MEEPTRPDDGTEFEVLPAERDDLRRLRDMYRQEMNCQIMHDSYFERGFTSLYLLRRRGKVAGYGCIGDYDSRGKEVVTEFYVTPTYRTDALPLFRALLTTTGATQVEAQTNDRFLLLMLYDCCPLDSVTSNTMLFEEGSMTSLPPPDGVTFRRILVEEPASTLQHRREDVVAEVDGQIIGKAGFLSHYNPPYGDVWMDVDEAHRGRGIGSYLVQEAKRACYEAGRRPAARCNIANMASRKTLQRAGFIPCARILRGVVLPAPDAPQIPHRITGTRRPGRDTGTNERSAAILSPPVPADSAGQRADRRH